MRIIFVALFLFVAPVALAYNPVNVTVDEPFSEIVIPMDEVAQQQSYLGTLETYPHLYEFSLNEKTNLTTIVRQRASSEAEPVNLIMLAVDPDTERISEIIRLNTPLIDRDKKIIGGLGIRVYESEPLELELDAGLYRLEVSTPINEGPYELDFGTGSVENSYFGTFGTILQVQQHFGYWLPRFLLSTFILYQIGIIVIIGGLYYTWKRRKRVDDVA